MEEGPKRGKVYVGRACICKSSSIHPLMLMGLLNSTLNGINQGSPLSKQFQVMIDIWSIGPGAGI